MTDTEQLNDIDKHIFGLADEVRLSLSKLGDCVTHAEFHSFMFWCFDEYKNFMMISRESFKDTLNIIISRNGNDTELFKVLLSHIDTYGAPKAFLIIATEYKNSNKDISLRGSNEATR